MASLVHPKHGKIIIPTKPKSGTGHWVFSWIDKKGGKTWIDLLVEEGWSWKDIQGLASSYILAPMAELPRSVLQLLLYHQQKILRSKKHLLLLSSMLFKILQERPVWWKLVDCCKSACKRSAKDATFSRLIKL